MADANPYGKESVLDQLKALSPEQHEVIEDRRKLSDSQVIAHIEKQHRIFGMNERYLQEFREWLAERRVLQKMNEDVAAFRETYGRANPAATLEEAHIATLAHLLHEAARKESDTLMRFVLAEIRRARALLQTGERLRMMERRLDLLERTSEKARETLGDQTMTPGQRSQKLREIFGML